MVMKSYQVQDKESFREFLANNREEMFTVIWNAIDEAFAKNSDCAYIAEFYLIEEKSNIEVTSEREDWAESLTFAQNYFAEIEEYEKCIKLKKLIEKVNENV